LDLFNKQVVHWRRLPPPALLDTLMTAFVQADSTQIGAVLRYMVGAWVPASQVTRMHECSCSPTCWRFASC
jgi:hypothetical protein